MLPGDEASVPEVTYKLYKGKLFIEWMRRGDDLVVHVFKPVEAAIREAESLVRKRCPALWPTSRDPDTRRLQETARVEQDRCDARRMTWRDAGGAAGWPDIGEMLEAAVGDVGLDVFDGRIERILELDAWNIQLYHAADVSDKRVLRLADSIADRFSDLKVRWPPEIFE